MTKIFMWRPVASPAFKTIIRRAILGLLVALGTKWSLYFTVYLIGADPSLASQNIVMHIDPAWDFLILFAGSSGAFIWVMAKLLRNRAIYSLIIAIEIAFIALTFLNYSEPQAVFYGYIISQNAGLLGLATFCLFTAVFLCLGDWASTRSRFGWLWLIGCGILLFAMLIFGYNILNLGINNTSAVGNIISAFFLFSPLTAIFAGLSSFLSDFLELIHWEFSRRTMEELPT